MGERDSEGGSPGHQIYHWNNNCESYWLGGKAMANGMLKILPAPTPSPPVPTPMPVPTPTPIPSPRPTPSGTCSFLSGTGMDDYEERIATSSQEGCCEMCTS